MSAPTTPPRCEPPQELRGVDGWHWVDRHNLPPVCRWWSVSGDAGFPSNAPGWANLEMRAKGWRYIAPVTPPAEVDALRAERDAAIARDRNASAAHAKRATDLWLVTQERDNLRAGTDRLIAERDTLRARVETLEAALRCVVELDRHHSPSTTDGRDWTFLTRTFADIARAALEGKP